MEVNRAEALRYLELGQTLILNGQLEKGLKLCRKAQNLFPNELGSETIRRVEALLAKRNVNTSTTSTDPTKETSTSHDSYTTKPSAKSGTSPTTNSTPIATSTTPKHIPSVTPPKFTSEQAQLVQSILNQPDNFYAALGVERTASSKEIKTAYRKAVLLIHPDKNFAPGAAEAFKIVSRAFTILSDQEKRTQYDIFGTKKPESFLKQRRQPAPSTRFHSQEQFEDLFRQFNQRSDHYDSDEWPYAQATQATTANQPAFLSFLTLSLLLGAFFLGLSYLMSPTPTPTSKTKISYPEFTFPKANVYHPHAFQTRKNGVSYVVSPWKMKKFRNQVTARQFKRFEREVERQYSKWLIKNKS